MLTLRELFYVALGLLLVGLIFKLPVLLAVAAVIGLIVLIGSL